MSINERILKVLKKVNSLGYIQDEDLTDLSKEEQELVHDIFNNDLLLEALNMLSHTDTESTWQQLKTKFKQKNKSSSTYRLNHFYKYAAIFIVAIGCLYLFTKKTTSNIPAAITVDNNAIQLILENGEIQQISIEDEKQITLINGKVIGGQKGSELNYSTNSQLDKLVYNELKTPNGKTFTITLSDNTVVHLNAGSSLRYPVNFLATGNREVFLKGEAYFEVTKDKSHPFIVKTNSNNIEVLGTAFNVSSYAENHNTTTALVEGSVVLYKDKDPKNQSLLFPGFKGTLSNKSAKAIIEKVDISTYTAWMKGDLIFKKMTFSEMAIKLERSYNVSIQTSNEQLKITKFSGSFNINIESIEDVLVSLNQIYPFNYSITNNNITITN